MLIYQLHNFYQHAGGEDRVLHEEASLLRSEGHEVVLFSASNDTLSGPLEKVRAALEVTYSEATRQRLRRALQADRPDIVHVHNFFPLLTPSVYDASQEAGVPVVQTLHNYRTLCPSGLLMRDGQICEDCVHGSPYQAVIHGCYRNSPLATLPVAHMVAHHRRSATWREKVDRFIALTQFGKQKYVEAGFPADKIVVKPNFSPDHGTLQFPTERKGALFVGRLSEEKGVRTLLEAWRQLDVPLSLIGDGPLASLAHGAEHSVVSLQGRRSPDEVAAEMLRSAFLIMPSVCYETFGLVIIEAFSQGTPVIASRLGVMAELVSEGRTGLLFDPGNPEDLITKVRWAIQHPTEMATMGLNARLEYEAHYTPQANYAQLLNIYESVIEHKKGHAHAASH